MAQPEEPLRRVSSGRIAYDTFSASDGAATDIPWTVDQLDPLQRKGSLTVEDGRLRSTTPPGGAFWAYPTGVVVEDYILEAKVEPMRLKSGGPGILLRSYSGGQLVIEVSFGYHHSDHVLRVIVLSPLADGVVAATTDETAEFTMATKTWYTIRLAISGPNMECYVDDVLVLNVTDAYIASIPSRRPYFGGYHDGEWGYWDDFKVWKANNITVSNLKQGQRVELYDDTDGLRASDTVEAGESEAGLDVSALTFPFKGYFRIYDTDGASLLYTTRVYEDVWGGDEYVFSLYGHIKAETQVETVIPLSAQVTIRLEAEEDGSPVEEATVRVDGVVAENVGGGVYRASLTTWMPFLTIKIVAEKFGYEPATAQTTHYLLGNIAVEGSVAIIISLVLLLRFRAGRKGKDEV